MGEKHRVIIEDAKYIPTIGKGPIRNPIQITDEQYKLFKILGFNVIECNDIKLNKINDESNDFDEKTNNDGLDEESFTKDDYDDESDNNDTEEIDEDVSDDESDISENIMIDDVDINSLTKKQIKSKLTELGVSYANNANLNQLRVLLIESIK